MLHIRLLTEVSRAKKRIYKREKSDWISQRKYAITIIPYLIQYNSNGTTLLIVILDQATIKPCNVDGGVDSCPRLRKSQAKASVGFPHTANEIGSRRELPKRSQPQECLRKHWSLFCWFGQYNTLARLDGKFQPSIMKMTHWVCL